MNSSNLYRVHAKWLFAVLFLTVVCSRPAKAVELFNSEVLVYGATPGGIAAAVSASKDGHSVTLVEPTNRIGGLLTCGLSYTDFRSFESLTGFFLELADRVERHYVVKYGKGSAQVKACFRGTHGEPSVNLLILEQMIGEQTNIKVIKQSSINAVEVSPLKLGRRRIVSASFRDQQSNLKKLTAKVFIDGSYEGDLMALAGEPYHVGRESRAQYGELLAGNERGEADGQVQGYNLRLIMTDVEANKRMPVAPEGYNRDDFVGVLPHFASKKLVKVFADGHDGIYRAHVPCLPNGKTDVNDTPRAPVRLSMPDINDGYPDGDATTRAEIIRQHYYYNVGLLYFLQNDFEVPAAIREDASRFGWCKDEFEETGGIPPQLYIREARRMIGQYVFTGRDTEQTEGDSRAKLHTDSIAIGDYVHNCHGTGREGTRFDGKHTGEFYKPVPPYQIPYGVIVPQKSENLLAPVACSASHFGFGALRLEPVWCSLGQAAGWAAAECIEDHESVQRVNVQSLQARLHQDKSATIYVADIPPSSSHFGIIQRIGTLGGLHGISDANQLKPASLGGQYCEALPGHFAELHKPIDDALADRWTQSIPRSKASIRNTEGATLTRAQWLGLITN